MFRNLYYHKPFTVAFILFILGIGLVIAGALLEASTGSMDYYALIAFGVFFLIASLVTFKMYLRMEKEYRKSMGGKPLLRYTVENNLAKENIERQMKDLKSTNRGLLFIMLFFCAVFGIVLSFLLEDGWIMAVICLGLAAFLFLTERIVTRYRVNKLKKGTDEYVLTENGAVVGGEFHCWNMPGITITSVHYCPSGESKPGILQIEYRGQSLAGENAQRLFLPIPDNLAKQIPEILTTLNQKIG